MTNTVESAPSSLTPSVAKRLLFYLIQLVLTWFLLEGLLVVLDPIMNKGFWQYDPSIGFRVRAYAPIDKTYVANLYGFNDRDHTPQKAPGTFRLICMGDSFNWMGKQDKNYTNMLQRMFDAAYGPNKVEVVNVGYPATHTAEELVILKKYAMNYHPDMLVLGFFIGNDFFDGDPYRKRIIVNGLYMDIDKRHEMRFLGYPILPQSRIVTLFKQLWATHTKVAKAPSGNPSDEFTKDTYEDLCQTYLTFFDTHKYQHGDLNPNLQYILGSLYDMNALLQDNHVHFKVAAFPCEEQVDTKLFNEVVADRHLDPKAYDLDQLQKILQAACDQHHIPMLNMLPDFRRENKKGESLYKYRNTHWNDAGNMLAAKLLFNWLKPSADQYCREHSL